METYQHTEDMGAISGLLPGHETPCQVMLKAGVEWLNEHPEANIAEDGSKDQETLRDVLMEATRDLSATWMMFFTVMERLIYIQQHGWDAYVASCKEAVAAG